MMLTQSRYLGDLRLAGRRGRRTNRGSCASRCAIPGGTSWRASARRRRRADWPLTRLAQDALEALAAGGPLEGVILEPYRDYRGAEVIGAWRWLPEKEMVIAVEIEAAEAYAPLKYLEIAFGIAARLLRGGDARRRLVLACGPCA